MRHSVVLDISEYLLDRWIDPDDFGDGGRLRCDATKADRIQPKCGGQRGLSLLADLQVRAVVHRRRGVQPNARVPVHMVVVVEEHVAERARILDAAEALGERRTVLEGLERCLTEGIVGTRGAVSGSS